MKMATPAGKTFAESDMLLIAKALEQRGATMDPAKMQAELSMIERIYTATQGRVDAQQILGNIQYAKGGLGQTMDLSFLPIFAAMIEQIKSAGGNGGQIGTALTSLQQSIINGTGSGQAQKERARLGLLDPNGLVWNKQGNIDQQKSNLRMAGAEEFQRNPYEWIQNYLKPAMIRAGIDLTNDAAVNQTLNKLFPNRNAANIAGMMTNRGALLEKDAANINQSKAGQDAREINIQTAKANIEAFKAQLENLGIVMGTTLLPAITTVAHAFTVMFEGLAEFFQAHPLAATFTTWAAAIGAVVLAIAGFAKVFGVASGMIGALFSLGQLPAVLSVVGAAVRTFIGVLGVGLTSLTGIVAAFFAGWELGSWIANLEIAGKQVRTWGADLIEWVVGAFRKGWGIIGQIVSSIIPGAQAAQAVGAAGPDWKRVGGASGSWNTGSVSGSWGPAGEDYGNEGRRMSPFGRSAGRLFASTTSPGVTSGGGRAAKVKAEEIGKAITDPYQQEKQDFLRSEKAVYTDLDKILAGIDKDAEKRAKDKAQAEYDAYRISFDKIGELKQDYSEKLAAIDDLERNGQISRTAAEAQKLAIIKEEADALDVLIAKQRQMPGGTIKDGIALDKLGQRNDSARAALPSDQIELLRTAQSGFQGFFRDILSGSVSAGNAFKRFGDTVQKTVLDLISKRLGDMLYDSIFGALMGGGGAGGKGGGGYGTGSAGGVLGPLMQMFGGGGGSFGSLAGAFSGYGFGGTGMGASMLATDSVAGGSFAEALASGIAVLDTGTNYVPHDMLAMIHEGESVTPKQYNPHAGGSGGGMPMINNFTINGPTDRRSQGQIAAEIESAASRQARRRR